MVKGFGMKLDESSKKRRHDWSLYQLNKLKWTFLEEDGVDRLIDQIYKLAQSLPHLYQRINM
jgi:hypothetical protein